MKMTFFSSHVGMDIILEDKKLFRKVENPNDR